MDVVDVVVTDDDDFVEQTIAKEISSRKKFII